MKNTGGSGRSKSAKDKGSSKSAQTHIQNTAKSEGPPMKTMQPTAEQLALNNLIHSKDSTAEDADLKDKIKQIMDLTFCSQEKAEIALYDSKNDMDKAVNQVLEGGSDESEWRESGKKKKKQKPEPTPAPTENHNDTKPDRRDNRDRNERDNRDRNKEEKENGERNFREQSDNYRQRARRNDNRPPRLSRGRGRPDRAGDRPERGEEENEKDDNRDRGFDRGRGRGRGFGPRRGRGGGSGGGSGGTFRPNRGFENKNSQFDNGPQIDTWTNETAVIGEKEPKISNWGDSKEDWNEDIDSWTGSLAETKVFTASGSSAPEPTNPVPIESNALSNTFDLGGLYPKHLQNDMSAEASYISQFNQQATESIKNSIGIGSGQSSSLQNSMTSQTASNVSALVSLQQNALHDNLGPSLTELTGNNLTGSGLTGNSLMGTSLGNSLSTSLPVNSLTGSALHSSSLSGNDLTGNSLTSLSGTSLAGNSLTGTSVTGSGLSFMTGSSLSAGSQSVAGPSNAIPASSVSQNAMLQQRQKPQRSKLPPPSKIPASAVEMPGNMMTTLDVQFGNLEFGSDSSAFSFGGNESVNSAFTSADSNSTSTVNDHGGATVGQVQNLSKTSESLISGGLEQSSPRSSSLYQQSPYTTPTKQNPADTANSINSPPESLQMQGSSSDLKSNQLMAGQAQPASLPSTKIDSNLGSYSSGSSYQSTGYQSQKSSAGYQSSTKPAGYSGTQYQSAPSQNQSNSSQFSSQYSRQSNQNQFQSNNSQFPSGSQYQSPPSGYQPSQSGYQSAQSGYQSNQQQYQSGQSQFQNFQSGSTFQNQSNYSSNQSNPSVLYPTTTSTSYSSQSPQNSLYSQSSRPNSYSNQSYLNEHATGAGSSFQTSVTQSSSAFKETQSGASSFRDNVASSTKTRDSQSDSSTFNRDTQSASSFSDSQSMAYNRDSQSVGSSFNRDPSSSFTRDSKSASGSYPRDTPTTDTGAYSRDSQSASASYSGRDSQSSTTGFRDTQTGASGYGSQAGSYPRETSQSQTQAGYSAKNYRNSTEVTSLQSSFTGSKLADNFSKMGVKDGPLDTIQSSSSQFDSVSSASKATINATSLTSSTTSSAISSTGTTVISSTTTKISTLPSATAASSKAPPNLPPGVPLMAQQYIMGQAGTLPFYGLQGLQGLQQPQLYNLEEFQYLQQRMPPLATSNMYDLQQATAAGLPIPPTTLNSNSTQQTIPTVPYSGSNDSSKLPRVDAQSPTGSVPSNSQQSGSGQSAAHQQPYIHLNYSYYYPPSLIPGAGFQYPMIPMPQVTNAAHAGTPANTQYQQKNYGSHVQYGTNKMYDDLTGQSSGDFSKSPYGTSQAQPKANSSVTAGSGSSDIQIPGYGAKTHTQGFHAGTPPPFNLQQMAAGQLATGTQAGPLGAPTAAYGAPFVPMMTHQPHSQMLHHPLQDATSSSRGSQQAGSHSQTKTASKSYTGSNWGPY
ncbi:ubiquitin-associated protein 2-like isoform X2 [Ruditapes philippinarum]|uniref:ubiquitin-associated protein 2-like isoform X2 n=1 Tax=Ruditapes philippinarum TaxID=129788 RepID=UPI00295B229D|nr:ubiquitin-associated protein 2-like isoform X2 [Ruditapes philippinarum]